MNKNIPPKIMDSEKQNSPINKKSKITLPSVTFEFNNDGYAIGEILEKYFIQLKQS